MNDEYKRAARANMEARERGEVREVEPVRAADCLPASELYERPRGWRRFVLKVRKQATYNTAMRRIAGTGQQ